MLSCGTERGRGLQLDTWPWSCRILLCRGRDPVGGGSSGLLRSEPDWGSRAPSPRVLLPTELSSTPLLPMNTHFRASHFISLKLSLLTRNPEMTIAHHFLETLRGFKEMRERRSGLRGTQKERVGSVFSRSSGGCVSWPQRQEPDLSHVPLLAQHLPRCLARSWTQ